MNHDHLDLLTKAAAMLRTRERHARRLADLLARAVEAGDGQPVGPYPAEEPGEDGPLALAAQLEDVARLLRTDGLVS